MKSVRLSRILSTFVLLAAWNAPRVWAHCQVPCGIFDDNMKLMSLIQDADTVIKAVTEIQKLEGKTDAQSVQQMVRWVNNKESHAQAIISSITDYYLTQRVKASQDDYQERLVKHHTAMVAAMKAKQSAGPEAAQALKDALAALEVYYPAPAHTH